MTRSAKNSTAHQSIVAGCHLIVLAVLAVGLSGCATPADPKSMTVVAAPNLAPFPQALHHAMCIRTVTGGEKKDHLWSSEVDGATFQSTLSSSMDSVGLNAPTNCRYSIDVNLLGMSQPSPGFNMTATSHVNYKVYDPSGQPLLLETIDAPYTATVSDAFVGVTRLRLANEGAIRKSVEMFFDKLRQTNPK